MITLQKVLFLAACCLLVLGVQAASGQDSLGVWSQNLSNGGRVYAMVVDPTNQSTLYSAGLDSGVYKSTNAGTTWFAVNNGLTYRAIQALAISPSNPSVLYAGTDPAVAGGTNKGVYVTTNGGTSWTRSIASSTWPDSGVQAIVVSPSNPNIAIVAVFDGVAANCINGLYKTTDGGTTWFADTVGIGLNKRFIALGINPLNGNTVYAGTSFMTAPAAQSKIYKSVNGGNTWADASNGLPQLTTNQDPVRAFSVSTADTSLVLAALFYNDTSGGPYVTINGGALWVKKYNGLPATTGTLLRSCVIKPGSTKEFYVGLDRTAGTDIGVRRTTDGGDTWTDFNGGTMLNTYAVRALVFKTTGSPTLYAGVASVTPASARGVYEYSWAGPPPPTILMANPGPANNGGSPNWAMFFNLIAGSRRITVTNMTTASTAAANASYNVVVFKRSGNALGGPVGSGPGSSTVGWDSLGTVPVTQGTVANGVSLLFAIPSFSVNPGETVGVAIRFLGAGPRYFGTGTPPYETYSDANLTLVTGDGRSIPFTPTGTFFASRALVGEIHYTVGSAPGFFDNFESFTAGQRLACQDSVNWTTWSLLPCNTTEDPLISNAFASSGTKSVAIVQNNDLVKRLGNDTTGIRVITFKFYVPTSKAGYFNTLAGFTPNPNSWAMQVYFDSAASGNNGRIFAGASTAFPFTYAHNAWQTVRVVVNLNIDSARFVINGNVVRTWRWTAGGFGSGGPRRLAANNFFGATAWDQMYVDDYDYHPDNVWTGVDEPNPEIPGTFALEQNYPNPFNPTTTIQYGLPVAANVTLKIYNILGQEIMTLVNEQKNPGTHQATWNSRNSAGAPVASGVYFYSLIAASGDGKGTFTNIKKMLFLK